MDLADGGQHALEDADVMAKRGNPGEMNMKVVVEPVEVGMPLGDGLTAADVMLRTNEFYTDIRRGGKEALDADAFFGCPDSERTCNKLTITATGVDPSKDFVTLTVNHLIEDADACESSGGICADDPALVDVRKTDSYYGHQAIPLIPVAAMTDNGDGSYTAIVYWQGQRRSDGDFLDYFWTRYPDLNSDGPDQFVFRGKRTTFKKNGSATTTVYGTSWHECPPAEPCRALYQGAAGSGEVAEVGTATERTEIEGRGRWTTEKIYLDIPVTTTGAMSAVEAIVINPDGTKSVPPLQALGGGDMNTVTVEAQDPAACHEIHLAQAYVFDPEHLERTFLTFDVTNDVLAWTPNDDVSAASGFCP